MIALTFIKRLLTVFTLGFLLFSLAVCNYNKTTISSRSIKLDNLPILKNLYKDNNIGATGRTYSWALDNGNGIRTATYVDTGSTAN